MKTLMFSAIFLLATSCSTFTASSCSKKSCSYGAKKDNKQHCRMTRKKECIEKKDLNKDGVLSRQEFETCPMQANKKKTCKHQL